MLVPHRPVPFEPFFEPSKLVLHLFNRPIQGREYSPRLLHGYKFIMVLGTHPQLQDRPLPMLHIDGHRNGRQPVKKLP